MNAQKKTIAWFKKNEPTIYRLAVKRHALKYGKAAIYGLSGVEEDELAGIGDFFSTMSETVTKIAPSIIALKAQKDILRAQLRRGSQGLPPLQVSDYSPVLNVNPQFSPESEAALTRVATSTTGNLFSKYGLYIAGALGVTLILLRKKRGN